MYNIEKSFLSTGFVSVEYAFCIIQGYSAEWNAGFVKNRDV